MKKSRNTLGDGARPFPMASKTQAQKDEDAFMLLHGGTSSVVIYKAVTALPSALRRLRRSRPADRHLPRVRLQKTN